MAPEIDLKTYVKEVKNKLNLTTRDEIIEKDLLLTLILAEFEKKGLGEDLIFKGGTLLSRNYLKYHRFSEDLDFIHKDSTIFRELSRTARERRIKKFIDYFVPELKKVADTLNLEFSTDRSNTKFCTVLHGRTVYIFRIYYSENRYIKIEINFVEKLLNKPEEVSVRTITDFFDSKELLFILGLKSKNFKVLSYSLEEIILEKYRAILTRKNFQERDLFDLFLIKGSLNVNIGEIIDKIKSSDLIKRDLTNLIKEKLNLLNSNEFFESKEKIQDLAIVDYDDEKYNNYKNKIRPILIMICKKFLNID